MNLVALLLKKNTSTARIAGFVLSNFIGLAIVCAGLQFFLDARSIWEADDSFIHSDYLVVNKKVTSANTFGNSDTGFSQSETDDIANQTWARKVGKFESTNYEVRARLDQDGRGMTTMMFFEAIPDNFIDVGKESWGYTPGDKVVPMIIAKDYLTLYNFGFASSAGLPQLSEQLMSGLPLQLYLTSEDGSRKLTFTGRVVGYSNRLNTVLVPKEFMDYTNNALATDSNRNMPHNPSRLIIDTSSPGDVAISKYLDQHSMEVAGDKTASQASFLLNVITGIVLCVGGVITVLSFFILMLSISLIMEKNRDKLHALLMLGYPLKEVGKPYERIALISSAAACLLSIAAVVLLRIFWIEPLRGLGAGEGGVWISTATAIVLTALIILFNIRSIRHKVRTAWRL